MQTETAVITGASTGIGRALAEVFARNGHDLLLVARSEDKLSQAAEELAGRYDVQCRYVAVDLTDPTAPATVLAAATADGRAIGVLVNNAGVLWEGPFADVSQDQHARMIGLNIVATTMLTHLFLPLMLARGHGRILNMSSTSGFMPVPDLATYAASKAYVLSLSEALWLETRGTGVTVTAVCPGFTDTDMIAKGTHGSMRLPLVPNLTAETVAAQAYDAGMAGRPVLVTGVPSRATVAVFRHLPMWLRREALTGVARFGF